MAGSVRGPTNRVARARPRVGDRGPQQGLTSSVYLGALMEDKAGLLVVMAHPDDESMGCGGLILRPTRAGIPVHLICATRGEKGWSGKPLGARRDELAQIRTHGLEEAPAPRALRDGERRGPPHGRGATVDR